MSKVTREEFNGLSRNLDSLRERVTSLAGESLYRNKRDREDNYKDLEVLEKRIDQLEKSDFATATRISTLLERTERLEERKPHKEPAHLLTAKACKHCGSKYFIIYMYYEWFKYKCSECGKFI